MVLTSWGIPFLFTLTLVSLIKLSAIDLARIFSGDLGLLFEIILCVILIFLLASMFLLQTKCSHLFKNTVMILHLFPRFRTTYRIH